MVQSIPDVNHHDVKNFDVGTNVKNSSMELTVI